MAYNWDDGSDWSNADWGTADDSSVGTSAIEGTNSADNAWASWDNSDSTQESQSSGWDSWDNDSGDNSNSSQSSGWDDWDSPSPSNPNMQNSQQQDVSPQQNQTPVQFNFGYKTIGIICVVGFILLALIFSLLNKINVNKNVNQGNTQSTQVVQQQTQNQQTQSQSQQSSSVINGSALADNVNVDYSASIQQASGVVQSLSRIVQDGQLLYCISISIPYNNSTVVVRNYCTYSAYNSVRVGDMVNVTYQVVNGNLISVNEVTK